MDRIDDERVSFYLKHREDIDSWLALKADASRALDDFLRQSAEQLKELAAQFGEDVVVRSRLASGRSRHIRFLRPGWRADHNIVRAAIQLEWSASRVSWGLAAGSEPAYVSVWANRDAAGGVELAAQLRQRLREKAKRLDLSVGSSFSWNPTWKYLIPEGDRYWEDLSGFRKHITGQLEWFWREFAGDIDEALKHPGDPAH